MEKNLTVYPISTGNELTVFATEQISAIKIMDMHGIVMYEAHSQDAQQNVIDIQSFPNDTYIVEVDFCNQRKGRSMFVKL